MYTSGFPNEWERRRLVIQPPFRLLSACTHTWVAGMVTQGISKRTEELPNHPGLRDATPWDLSSELTPATKREHVRLACELHTVVEWVTSLSG